jgi:hypothetical protein
MERQHVVTKSDNGRETEYEATSGSVPTGANLQEQRKKAKNPRQTLQLPFSGSIQNSLHRIGRQTPNSAPKTSGLHGGQ